MQVFPSNFIGDDLLGKDTINVFAGQPVRLGEFTVPADVEISFGQGDLVGQNTAIGRFFADIKNATGEVNGLLRIAIYNSQNNHLSTLMEYRTERARMGATDPTQRISLARRIEDITRDRKIVLEFIADADGTITKADSRIEIDITKILL